MNDDEATLRQPLLHLGKDFAHAQTPDDIIELRKQETRRRITYAVVLTFCLAVLYLTIWVSEMRSEVFTGLVGIVAGMIGYYFGAKQTGQ